ncbi:MAG: Ig domain-containing protein, partial [Myxococcales bacterium]
MTFSAAGLPPGLALDPASGVLSGIATASGELQLVVTVTDSRSKTATRGYPLKVYDAPRLLTDKLPDGTVGLPYQQKLNATGGKAPLTVAVTSGSLPAGVELQPAELALGGTPTAEGPVNVTLTVKDANGATAQQSYAFQIAARLVISTTTLPVGEVNLAYSAELRTTGGKAPITFAATGLPAGLTLDTAAGRILGTPSVDGASTVALTATDAAGVKAEASLTLTVLKAVAIQTAALADAYVGESYTQPLTASEGQSPYTWSLGSGNTLPAGLALDPAGTLTGTPSAPGSSNVALVVTDRLGGTANRLLPLQILPLPAISTAALPDAYTGAAYNQSLAASGGKAPFTWTIGSGALPAGLSLSATGELTGTATAPGTATVQVRAVDANGKAATRSLTLAVFAPPAIGTATLVDAYVG